MFDVAPTELLLLGAVAVAVIPPKDLPRAMRFAGQWIGKARGMARHFRSGLDEMIRQAELEDIEKKWRDENERIMREHPLHDAVAHAPVEASPAIGASLDAGHTIAPPPAEHGAEVPPPALPHGSVPPSSMSGPVSPVEENGPELPLGLPPAR